MKIKLTLLAIILGLSSFWFWYEAPLKVKDPTDPRFNPDKFAFRDYEQRDDLRYAFRELFPLGTPKSFVDRVLVEAGQAAPHKRTKNMPKPHPYSWFTYIEPSNFLRSIKGNISHQFLYDENLQVINVMIYSGVSLYDDQRSFSDQIRSITLEN